MGVRGHRSGHQWILLSSEQESDLRRALIYIMPGRMKISFALWTRDAMKLSIQQWFEVEMPIRMIGTHLKRREFIPQKSVKQVYEHSSQAAKRWLMTEYPTIACRAK